MGYDCGTARKRRSVGVRRSEYKHGDVVGSIGGKEIRARVCIHAQNMQRETFVAFPVIPLHGNVYQHARHRFEILR